MTLDESLNAVDLADARETLAPGWEASAQARPAGPLFFLNPGFVAEACLYAGVDKAAAAEARALAPRVDAHPALRALAWHAHHRAFRERKNFGDWPAFDRALGQDAGIFYLLVLLSGFPEARNVHRERRIPDGVVRETMSDVQWHLESHRRRTGRWGLDAVYAGGWLVHHLRGEIYRLGRLQFMPLSFPKGQRVFRNNATRDVVALAEGDIEFRADGQRNGAGGQTEHEERWRSRLLCEKDATIGHPIAPEAGGARRAETRLPMAVWTAALVPGETCLDIHIPAGEAMTIEACGRSIENALAFFPRHFPERPAKALICNSWLLDAQLERILPAASNIVRFLREFYLFPVPSDAWSAVRYVFGMEIPYGTKEGVDLSRASRETSLQRAILDHLKNGGHLRKAGGFILLDDLCWGSQVYRSGRAKPS